MAALLSRIPIVPRARDNRFPAIDVPRMERLGRCPELSLATKSTTGCAGSREAQALRDDPQAMPREPRSLSPAQVSVPRNLQTEGCHSRGALCLVLWIGEPPSRSRRDGLKSEDLGNHLARIVHQGRGCEWIDAGGRDEVLHPVGRPLDQTRWE